jgi:hypothetical protein
MASEASACTRPDHADLVERIITAERRALAAEATLRELACEQAQCSHHLVAIWRERAEAAAADRNRLAQQLHRQTA